MTVQMAASLVPASVNQKGSSSSDSEAAAHQMPVSSRVDLEADVSPKLDKLIKNSGGGVGISSQEAKLVKLAKVLASISRTHNTLMKLSRA